MKEIKTTTYKGTRILVGNKKRDRINAAIKTLIEIGFKEIQLPIIQMQKTFKGKVGEENNNLMFNFKDRGNRDVCLAPEYTAVVQKLANTDYKDQKDVKLFYVQQCFRGEKPQAGRYREFTQLGVEILNPSGELTIDDMADLALSLLEELSPECTELCYLDLKAKRGLDYYKEGKGFEISTTEIGSACQLVGGGEYKGGIGFAIGIDRVLLLDDHVEAMGRIKDGKVILPPVKD